jgi:hypothetical protein
MQKDPKGNLLVISPFDYSVRRSPVCSERFADLVTDLLNVYLSSTLLSEKMHGTLKLPLQRRPCHHFIILFLPNWRASEADAVVLAATWPNGVGTFCIRHQRSALITIGTACPWPSGHSVTREHWSTTNYAYLCG